MAGRGFLTRARGSTLSYGVTLPRYRRIGTRTRDSVARMAAVRAGHRRQADTCTIADDAPSAGANPSSTVDVSEEFRDLLRRLFRRTRVLTGHEVAIDHGVGDKRQPGLLIKSAALLYLLLGVVGH